MMRFEKLGRQLVAGVVATALMAAALLSRA